MLIKDYLSLKVFFFVHRFRNDIDMNEKETVVEIIQKECELYRLKEFGLLTSVEEEADRLLRLLPDRAADSFTDMECFSRWRKKVTDLFYSRLDYTAFLKRNKHTITFSRFLLSLRKRLLRQLQTHWKQDTIDSSLAIPSHTLAFKLSVMLSEEADQLLYPFIDSFVSPDELEDNCDSFCKSYYPVDMEKLLAILRKDDKEFWNDIYLFIKYQAVRVTSCLLLSNQYRDEIEQDTWCESSLLFREKILTDVIPSFDSAIHLRNYIVRICRNKCYEVIRCNKSQEVPMSTPEMDFEFLMEKLVDDTESVCLDMDISRLSDIDINCNYEVSTALTSVLWNKIDPYYSWLVKGIEDKVDALRLHYVDGLSYEKIALLRAPDISTLELHRMQARLRQDVVRVRKVLKERFMKILVDL